jgi:hypothetical protein
MDLIVFWKSNNYMSLHIKHYQAGSDSCEKCLWPCHVCVSICMCQCNFHQTDLSEIWYWRLLWKSVEEFQILSKLSKNVGHCMWRPKYVLSLLVTLNHCEIPIFESVVSACYDSRGDINITGTHHSVICFMFTACLYVWFLQVLYVYVIAAECISPEC